MRLVENRDAKRTVKRTGMRSLYFCRIRSASALRFSKGCSSLNFDRILTDLMFIVVCEVFKGDLGVVEKFVVDGEDGGEEEKLK